MADVTIGNLPPGNALGQCFVPMSDTLATIKARVSALQVDYANITSKPTIPAAQVNSDWNAASGLAQILNKPTSLGGLGGMQAFTSSGTFTAPAGVTKVKVTVISGGGGGGGSAQGGCGGAGGCTGGTAIGVKSVTPGASYAVVVGGAGGGGSYRNYGGAGGQSSFGGTTIYATGGQPGGPCIGCSGSGAGVGGDLNLTGQVTIQGFGAGGGGGAGGSQYGTSGGAGGPGLVTVEW